MAVSSAQSLTLDVSFPGKSFMYAQKKTDSKAEPCGTHEETGQVLEFLPLVTTDCFLLSEMF